MPDMQNFIGRKFEAICDKIKHGAIAFGRPIYRRQEQFFPLLEIMLFQKTLYELPGQARIRREYYFDTHLQAKII